MLTLGKHGGGDAFRQAVEADAFTPPTAPLHPGLTWCSSVLGLQLVLSCVSPLWSFLDVGKIREGANC